MCSKKLQALICVVIRRQTSQSEEWAEMIYAVHLLDTIFNVLIFEDGTQK